MKQVSRLGTPPDDQPSARRSPDVRYSIDAVVNAVKILGALVEHKSLSLTAAAEAAGVSKSTAYRLLATLEMTGLVERPTRAGYVAGPQAIRWGMKLIDGVDVRVAASPFARALRDRTGETVNVAGLRGNSVVYVEILESPSAFRMSATPESLVPMHAAAIGKAIAAHLEPARLATLLGPEPFDSFTPNTVTSWTKLADELARIRQIGHATDMEEVEIGVVCVGAPIFLDERIVGAMSVSAPRARISDGRAEEFGRQVAQAARQASKRLTTGSSP